MNGKDSEYIIFFDDGGVLNDNQIRAKQWQELIGQYLVPRFGGKSESWGIANKKFIETYSTNHPPKIIIENLKLSHRKFMNIFIEKWINEMFDFVGIKRPKKENYREIYYNTVRFVSTRIIAAFPGVVESIKELYENGFTLCTASGMESIELQLYLEGMGIKQYFKQFYGPDLINMFKIDDKFYRAIIKDLNIIPEKAIIIDDQPYYLKYVQVLGANVVQACLTGEFSPQFPDYLLSMKDLPKVIKDIVEKK